MKQQRLTGAFCVSVSWMLEAVFFHSLTNSASHLVPKGLTPSAQKGTILLELAKMYLL